ncbi:MAG: DUF2808 domain-containing protein [Nodosilinea sp.]
MRLRYFWAAKLYTALLAVMGGLLPLGAMLIPTATSAIQYSDGTVGFSYPLRLTDSYATRNRVSDGNVTYYLTFDFPAAALEPLDKVVVSLDEGRDPAFSYQLDAVQAFTNTPAGQVPIALGELTQDADSKALTVLFDPPLPPGSSVTLALKPTRNPRFAGVYLFGATAFPVGQDVRPTFMGYARLTFYERDGNRWP